MQAFEAFVDDLSNWYIRRSRRRFWEGDQTALRVLWDALDQAMQVISPVMPFLAEHLWREPRRRTDESVFLAPWPEAGEVDETLLAEVAEVRRVVELGRQARAASGLKLRQPLRRLVVAGARARALARGRDRRGAAREGGRVRRGRRERAAREAEPARARAEARRRAARRSRGAAGGAFRGARRRPLPRGRARARAGRGVRRARRQGGLGGGEPTTG